MLSNVEILKCQYKEPKDEQSRSSGSGDVVKLGARGFFCEYLGNYKSYSGILDIDSESKLPQAKEKMLKKKI